MVKLFEEHRVFIKESLCCGGCNNDSVLTQLVDSGDIVREGYEKSIKAFKYYPYQHGIWFRWHYWKLLNCVPNIVSS